ncbi:helix-turn-helix domain-containing protein [Streptomyces sp. ID05-04B]|uniref:helix-turn-helix domain-containing protein n=1 Tax=Streptomyces sp. ID05-04B TaxID=3028661 RepID=UPI0029C283CC|nr:helix-turn-helix domain-containing protein [Streptomyces sp. ID05-04B]MDX5566683.1 helix-turn-helix domain-containing protein [Streptomyces sp. ID05-04B]
MAVTKPIAAPRPAPGVRRSATHSGVTHVRAYQSSHYTIIGNHLAQHRALSLTAIGLATHILSLPQGAPVDIRSLADRFPEGRDRISFGLRELEAHGYLERVRERTGGGRFVTRTYAHNAPALTRGRAEATAVREEPVAPAAVADRVTPVAAVVPAAPVVVVEAVEVEAAGGTVPEEAPTPSSEPFDAFEPFDRRPSSSEHRDKAFALLAGLRRADDRFTLSRRDVERLTPAVVAWFGNGASRAAVIHAVTADVPALLKSPAGFLAHRLREGLPPPLPAPAPSADHSGAPPTASVPIPPDPWSDPWTDCEGGCTRVFRESVPDKCCRECRARRAAASPGPPVRPV